MDFVEFSAKTVDDAITDACQKFTVTSDKLEYEVIEEGSSGFLGIGAKPAVIKARVKSSVSDKAKDFLKEVFEAMDMTELTSIPSVTSSTHLTTLINQMHPNVKFYVNDDLYNQFISETNWTSISSHIVGVKLNDNYIILFYSL